MVLRRTSPALWAPAILLILVACTVVACLRAEPLIAVSGPKDILRFEVREGSGEVLWAIEATGPTAVAVIFYGEVPLGFRQTFPAEGEIPRLFQFYEAVEVETTTTQRGFLHWGHASGPGQMDIGGSKTWLLELPDEPDGNGQTEAEAEEEAS